MSYIQEEWKPAVGFNGRYEISNIGNVRTGPQCGRYVGNYPLRTSRHHRGYRIISLWRDGKKASNRIHCLVAEAFIGPRPPGMQVNHKDGNKVNNALWNLEYVTGAENLGTRTSLV